MRWLDQVERAAAAIDGDRQFFLLEGYDRLAAWLLDACDPARLTLRLNTVAQRVEWEPGKVTVHPRSPEGAPLAPISAARAVVTLPIGVLAAPAGELGALQFVPPPAVLAGRSRRGDGPCGASHAAAARALLGQRRWEPLPSPLSLIPAFQPSCHADLVDELPAAAAAAHGLDAEARLPGVSPLARDDEVIAASTGALADILGFSPEDMAALVEEGYFHNWSRDPYTRGAYSYVTVGGLEKLAPLARPIADTLYFAGEGTDTEGHTGTVHAALATGERAARQITG